MFSKTIIDELKRHNILKHYWSDEIEEWLRLPITLKYEAAEYVGFYKSDVKIELDYLGDKNELINTTALLMLRFCSMEEEFSLERAMKAVQCSINATVWIMASGKIILISKFYLWNDISDNFEGAEDVLRLFI
jgi:hypothetical protein